VTEGAEEGFLKGGKCITQVHLHKRPYTKLKRANGNMNSGEKEKLRSTPFVQFRIVTPIAGMEP